jgi:hypothetical protein
LIFLLDSFNRITLLCTIRKQNHLLIKKKLGVNIMNLFEKSAENLETVKRNMWGHTNQKRCPSEDEENRATKALKQLYDDSIQSASSVDKGKGVIEKTFNSAVDAFKANANDYSNGKLKELLFPEQEDKGIIKNIVQSSLENPKGIRERLVGFLANIAGVADGKEPHGLCKVAIIATAATTPKYLRHKRMMAKLNG